MPVRNYAYDDTNSPKEVEFEYTIQLFKNTEQSVREWYKTIGQKDFTDKVFNEKQKVSYILSLYEEWAEKQKDDLTFFRLGADIIECSQKQIFKKTIHREYNIEYECFKTGYEETITYATQKGIAYIVYNSCSNGEAWEQWVEWEDKKKTHDGESVWRPEENWRWCEYNEDYYIPQDDKPAGIEEDITTYSCEVEDDEELCINW